MKMYLSLNFLVPLLLILGINCSSKNSNSESKEATDITKIMEIKAAKVESKKQKESIWKIEKFVDEFGVEVVGKSAIIGIFKGEKLTSSTTNSNVKVKLQIGKDKESYITFFEYGDIKGNLPNKKLFKIRIKKEDNTTEFIKQFSRNNTLMDSKGHLIENVLAQETPLKVNVDLKRASKYESTVYNFEINPKGLKEILEN